MPKYISDESRINVVQRQKEMTTSTLKAEAFVSFILHLQQECIPIGCVPPAHYRTGEFPPGQRPL